MSAHLDQRLDVSALTTTSKISLERRDGNVLQRGVGVEERVEPLLGCDELRLDARLGHVRLKFAPDVALRKQHSRGAHDAAQETPAHP
eukprot:7391778-Prymnesium_polylepis.2